MNAAVSTVQEIKSAIARLPMAERAALVAELCGWTHDAWDHQMMSDAGAGKFAAMNEAAANDYSAGRTKPLDDLLDRS